MCYNNESLNTILTNYLSLLDQPHKGIIAIMDEACLNVGEVTDSMLLEEMDRKLKGHNHYSSRRYSGAKKGVWPNREMVEM